MKRISGFTLVEVLIATSIMAVVMLTVYSSFHTGILGFKNIEEAIDISQSARHILERVNLDLRNAVSYAPAQAGFSGAPEEISFFTVIDTYGADKITQDYAFVGYKLEGDRLMRLCRINQESLKEKSELQPEEMASGIEELSFNYGYKPASAEEIVFDKDSWDKESRLPLAVKIKLVFKNAAKDTFERTVFLPLAR